eukprot:6666008-Pyramimonas_sp.AAC.1
MYCVILTSGLVRDNGAQGQSGQYIPVPAGRAGQTLAYPPGYLPVTPQLAVSLNSYQQYQQMYGRAAAAAMISLYNRDQMSQLQVRGLQTRTLAGTRTGTRAHERSRASARIAALAGIAPRRRPPASLGCLADMAFFNTLKGLK